MLPSIRDPRRFVIVNQTMDEPEGCAYRFRSARPGNELPTNDSTRKVTLAAMIGAILSVSRFSAHMFLIRIRPCRMSDLHLASNSG